MSDLPTINWYEQPVVPKNLSTLSNQDVVELREQLQRAISRREFLISDRGYHEIVTRSEQTIERIKRDVESFLEARVEYPSHIDTLKHALDRVNQLSSNRAEARVKASGGKTDEQKLDARLEKIKDRTGIAQAVVNLMLSNGMSKEMIVASLTT